MYVNTMLYIRWDSDVPDTVYLENDKRTLDSILEDYKTQKFSCKQPPLLEIETDHIIPDELHLLLRITDVLTENLITTAIKQDKRTLKTKWELNDGPMVTSIISMVRSCGIPFNIWKNQDSKTTNFTCTSLVGNKKKNLIKFLPSKLHKCQPSNMVNKVTQLWEVRIRIILILYLLDEATVACITFRILGTYTILFQEKILAYSIIDYMKW